MSGADTKQAASSCEACKRSAGLEAALRACVKAWQVNGNAEIPLREARALLEKLDSEVRA